MSRAWWAPALLAIGLLSQQKPPGREPPRQQEAPVEEDESLAPKQYTFNPVQAEREVRVGNYYFRKGSYRAAAQRYREATKWNGQFAEAYLRLGEAEEKQREAKSAREAYEKYLELAPDAGNRAEVVRKLAKLRGKH